MELLWRLLAFPIVGIYLVAWYVVMSHYIYGKPVENFGKIGKKLRLNDKFFPKFRVFCVGIVISSIIFLEVF